MIGLMGNFINLVYFPTFNLVSGNSVPNDSKITHESKKVKHHYPANLSKM